MPKVEATLQAEDCADACNKAFQGMDVDTSAGVCTCSNLSGRRRILAGQFSVVVLLDPEKVDASTAIAAVTQLENAPGVSASLEDVEPTAELQNVQGINTDALAEFAELAEKAVELNGDAEAAEGRRSPPRRDSRRRARTAAASEPAAETAHLRRRGRRFPTRRRVRRRDDPSRRPGAMRMDPRVASTSAS